MSSKMNYTKGEIFNIRFRCKIKLEFHGARLSSAGELLAGYEDLNDANQLSLDPVMGAVTGKKKKLLCLVRHSHIRNR